MRDLLDLHNYGSRDIPFDPKAIPRGSKVKALRRLDKAVVG
jgi:hypothetical protein